MNCRACPAVLGPRREGRAHGLCRNCWVRWSAAGFPEGGPPAPEHPWGRVLTARLEDYSDLRSWHLTREQAAARMHVSLRTAERYEAILVAEGNAPWRERERRRAA